MSRAHSQGTTTQWRNLRAACFRVWGKACLLCGDRATDVDHVIELAAGGTNTIDNVQPLCKACHQAKTSKFNSTQKNKKNPVFSKTLPPTDSLSFISPRLIRFDPPTTERPRS